MKKKTPHAKTGRWEEYDVFNKLKGQTTSFKLAGT